MVSLIHVFKGMSVLIVILLFLSVLNMLDLTVWRGEALPALISQVGTYVKYGFNFFNYSSTFMFITLLSALAGSFDSFLRQVLLELSQSYYNSIWLSQTAAPLPDYASILMNVYYFGFQILLAVSIIFAVMFIIKSKSKYAITSFICLQGMVVLAALFGYTVIGETPLSGNPLIFFTNPIILYIFLSYFYFEITITNSHIDEIFHESALQHRKFIEKMEALKSVRLEDELSQPKTAFNVEKTIELFKLSTYLQELSRTSPGFASSISAKSVLPKPAKIVSSFLSKSLLRIFILTLLVFICVNPVPVLSLFAPPAVLESVEFLTPEITILLLLPISLMFPLVSLVSSYMKRKSVKPELKSDTSP